MTGVFLDTNVHNLGDPFINLDLRAAQREQMTVSRGPYLETQRDREGPRELAHLIGAIMSNTLGPGSVN